MKKQDIIKKINKILGENVCEEEISEEKALKEDLGLDSLSLVAVIVCLEEEFNITFDDGDLDPSKLLKVMDLYSLVEKSI